MDRMNLLKLIKDNAEKPRTWSIKAEGDELVLYIYDVIGGFFGGVNAQEVAEALDEHPNATSIHVRINSPGGDVFDGVAIGDALKRHPAQVYAHIDGLAASAATGVAMAADWVEIAEGGMFMIHNAWTIVMGNRHEMTATATLLGKVDADINKTYAKKTGASTEQITEWMDAETWFTAEEAKVVGFVDAIADEEAQNRAWKLSAYKNAPQIEPSEPTADRPDFAAMERRLKLMEKSTA